MSDEFQVLGSKGDPYIADGHDEVLASLKLDLNPEPMVDNQVSDTKEWMSTEYAAISHERLSQAQE